MTEYTVKVYPDGTEWWLNGQLHRADGPAIECSTGYKKWYLNGQLHRADGPAVERSNGYKEWWLNGQRHRDNGPAVEHSDGTKEWRGLNGVRQPHPETVKEMTVAEVSAKLGYEVKIVK